ncbi:MAG: phosphoribosylglycinamide formyltransferase [Candidatus Altiarchaeota archaeon]|nr:phosphoribosylglycinamide formyltransferase [Candidatus Altiarchaeota archaeon]
MARIGVLASGSGSNFQALIDAVESGYIPDSKIVVLISDKPGVLALERAKKHGIEAVYVDVKCFHTREGIDNKIVSELSKRKVEIVCLAGYMRIVTRVLLKKFPERVLNIHPALLPSFPGLHAQAQAYEYGVKISGCTVHFVDDRVDHGPIIIQAAVPVLENEDNESLRKRILAAEHKIYPHALKWLVEGRLKVVGRRVKVEGVSQAAQVLVE